MMKILLLNTFLIILILNSGIDKIDFYPKQLNKEIIKISGTSDPVQVHTEDLKAINIDTSKGRFFRYSNTNPVEYAYVGRVNTCRAEGCSARNAENKFEVSEFFDYFILFDSTVSVLSVRIYNYKATHGYEITVNDWLKQFTGYNADRELVVEKDVDAISGATVSVYSITDDIYNKTSALKKYLKSSAN